MRILTWGSRSVFVASVLLLASTALGGVLLLASTASAAEARIDANWIEQRGRAGELPTVAWRLDAVRAAAARGERARIRDFPLEPGLSVDLDVEPFRVTSARTRFVLGRKGLPDRELAFDPASVPLLRGSVRGRPGSHVFLALGADATTGHIELGDGRRYRLARRDREGRALARGTTSVFRQQATAASPSGGLPPDVPFCGVADDGGASAEPPLAAAAAAPTPAVGLRHLELAVDTDHEFWLLFGDTTAAAAYLTALYGEVSAVFARDQETWVELAFARLWDDPNDLFNDVDPSPLADFRSWWNANMGGVQRDAAQLLSGRRDYPFGGQAYLSALCGSAGYSVVGYAMGFFPDPSKPSPYHYDISVTAHELGHNAGTGHTHSSPNFVDSCDDPLTTPQRGTIMSYCGQTWSGGNANRDLWFHTRIRQNMEAHISTRSCVVDDCNVNGVADALDISGGTSSDADGNGVPDECEDCNANAVLDDQDIAGGTSQDLDGDGVPDECQADCNGNGVPDVKDVDDGVSLDAHGNGVPDECEADCDASGGSDYSQIQANMTLDVDRNAVLDACQDCDADGTHDLEALAGAHGLWMGSGLASEPLRHFHATTGVRTSASSGALVDSAQDVIVVPDGRVLVSSADDDRVLAFDASGAYLGDLVAAGAGGLDHPAGLLWLPDGRLLVASHLGDAVLAYDGASGASLGAFVPAGTGGLVEPFGLTRGPSGNVFVTSGGDAVLEFDGDDGAFVGVFVDSAANGGLLGARGLVFKADGNLLVASYGSDETLEYARDTGAPLGRWALSGNDSGTRLNQVSPWGVRVGPNGNVYIVRTGEAFGAGGDGHDHGDGGELHLTNAQIYEFDVANGNFLRAHINGNDHGHEFPTGFDFVPGETVDCNLNQLPDSCDVSSGSSADLDGDGTPDECQLDCNLNGVPDRLDLIPFGTSLDCNHNRIPDGCDVAAGAPGACVVACNDGVDGDGDGRVDYPSDPGCWGFADDSELEPDHVCDDGMDNDGDGDIDFPGDPGCNGLRALTEAPQCDDGIDNDGDGDVDWDGAGVGDADTQCSGKGWLDNESQATGRRGCGVGAELGLLLPLLAAARRKRPLLAAARRKRSARIASPTP